MRQIAFTILLVFLFCNLVSAAEPPPLPVCEVKSVVIPPTIDGKLDDSCWQSVERMKDFTQIIHGAGAAKYPTEAMVCCDTRNIYLGIVCFETEPLEKLLASHTEHDSDVWADDGAEIFIDPNRKHSPFYHLSVNSRGGRYDAQGMDKSWDLKWEAAGQLGQGKYTIEAAIPFAAFGQPPQSGDVWGFNLCRDHYANSQHEWSCWSNTLGGFHNAARFGLLIFDSCRAALRKFVEDDDEAMARALLDADEVITAKGSAGERRRLDELRQTVDRVRTESKSSAPLRPSEWSALCDQWRTTKQAIEELNLDVKFRLLLEE